MQRWIAILLLALAVAMVVWWNRGDVAAPDPGPPDAGARDAAGGAATERAEAPAREQAQHGEQGEPAAPAAAAPAAAQPQGVLVVVVVDEADGVLPGCTVTVDEDKATTDARGRAEFTVPALRLPVGAQPPEGSPLLPARGWQTVRAGATTEVRLVLAAQRTFAFCCRLVAEEDNRPLRGAQVSGPA